MNSFGKRAAKSSPLIRYGIPTILVTVLGTVFLSQVVEAKFLTSKRPKFVKEENVRKRNEFSLEDELEVCLPLLRFVFLTIESTNILLYIQKLDISD
jgi:hypothetical protein